MAIQPVRRAPARGDAEPHRPDGSPVRGSLFITRTGSRYRVADGCIRNESVRGPNGLPEWVPYSDITVLPSTALGCEGEGEVLCIEFADGTVMTTSVLEWSVD